MIFYAPDDDTNSPVKDKNIIINYIRHPIYQLHTWIISPINSPPSFRPSNEARLCWPERRFVACVHRRRESPSSGQLRPPGTSGHRVLPIPPEYRSVSPWTIRPPQENGLGHSWLKRKIFYEYFMKKFILFTILRTRFFMIEKMNEINWQLIGDIN